jgi:adenine/guanine phosphoribosyltransferase-like PRPP-binding protein
MISARIGTADFQNQHSFLRHHDADGDPAGFRSAIDGLATPFEGKGIDLVVGIESQGSSSGTNRDCISAGVSPVRKPGKLPSKSVRLTHDPPTALTRSRYTGMRWRAGSAC